MKKYETMEELLTVKYDHYHCARIISYATIIDIKIDKLEGFVFKTCKFANCDFGEIENCSFRSCTINNSNKVGKLTGGWVVFTGSCLVGLGLRDVLLSGERPAKEIEFSVNWLTKTGKPVWFDYDIGKFRLAGWDHPVVEVN